MKKVVLLFLAFMLGVLSTNAASFKVFRKDSEVMLSRDRADWYGDYEYLPKNDTSFVYIDNMNKVISVGDSKFEFMDVPNKWLVKKTHSIVRYECIDLQSLEKVFVYIIKYDTTSNWRLLVVRFDGLDSHLIEMFSMR